MFFQSSYKHPRLQQELAGMMKEETSMKLFAILILILGFFGSTGLSNKALADESDAMESQVDDMAQTNLDKEVEDQQSQQNSIDHQYVQDQTKKTAQELKQTKKEVDSLKNKNEKMTADIKTKMGKIQ